VRVELLSYTPEPDLIVFIAARLCYSSLEIERIKSEFYEKPDYPRKLLSNLIEKGHHSVLEHASFTFYIEGISRITTHQLVRHRIASYSQQSQRYVKLGDKWGTFVVPDSLKDVPEVRDFMKASLKLYQKLVDEGIPREDARYVLSQGITSRIIVTMNARELRHFFSLRLHPSAQWEIRDLARRMLNLVKDKAPIIFADICEKYLKEEK